MNPVVVCPSPITTQEDVLRGGCTVLCECSIPCKNHHAARRSRTTIHGGTGDTDRATDRDTSPAAGQCTKTRPSGSRTSRSGSRRAVLARCPSSLCSMALSSVWARRCVCASQPVMQSTAAPLSCHMGLAGGPGASPVCSAGRQFGWSRHNATGSSTNGPLAYVV